MSWPSRQRPARQRPARQRIARQRIARFNLNASELGLIVAIVTVAVLITLLDTQHNYLKNPVESLEYILWHASMLGIVALGAAVVIISGGIDLSSGSMIAFSAAVCASIILLLAPEAAADFSQPVGWGVIGVAILGTLVVAFLVGTFHAWLITVVGLPPFVATLASLVGLRSFARWIIKRVTFHVSAAQHGAGAGSESGQINIDDVALHGLADTYVGPLVVFLVLIALCTVLLSRTAIGRHLYATGGNEDAARLSGIRTHHVKWLAYGLSAVFSAIAGILYLSHLLIAKPHTLAVGYELNAIAGAVVGGCSLQGGVGTVLGTVLGCVFLRTVIDGIGKVIKADANTYEGLIVGIVVVVAVAFNQLRQATGRQTRFLVGGLGTVIVMTLALLAAVVGGLLADRTTATIAGVTALGVLGTMKALEARAGPR